MTIFGSILTCMVRSGFASHASSTARSRSGDPLPDAHAMPQRTHAATGPAMRQVAARRLLTLVDHGVIHRAGRQDGAHGTVPPLTATTFGSTPVATWFNTIFAVKIDSDLLSRRSVHDGKNTPFTTVSPL